MPRKTRQLVKPYWWLSIFFVAAFSGCTTTASFYPVEGPLSRERPVPVIVAEANGISGNSGDIFLTMPDGETCKGKWASAAGAGASVGFSSLTGSTIGAKSLFNTYGSIYGFSAGMNTGTGQNPGQAMLICNRGRVLQMEFVTGAGTKHGFGLAKDNRGNVYKVVF